MATLDFAGRVILPQPGAGRRIPLRRRMASAPAKARGAALRRRGTRAGSGSERVYTWALQGLICLAMAGMVLFFRAPLGEAARAILGH